jgi:acyl CoA:acetate/3-ketoacid CoA transferase beta subunit
VHRVISDLAVMDVTSEGLRLIELAPGVSAREVQEKTEARAGRRTGRQDDDLLMGSGVG